MKTLLKKHVRVLHFFCEVNKWAVFFLLIETLFET